MRTFIGILALAAASGAVWTSFQAWTRRSPLGKAEDTPGLALGRLTRADQFTPRGWRYRKVTIALYVLTMALAYLWLTSAPVG
jgi:hypothetical protein